MNYLFTFIEIIIIIKGLIVGCGVTAINVSYGLKTGWTQGSIIYNMHYEKLLFSSKSFDESLQTIQINLYTLWYAGFKNQKC